MTTTTDTPAATEPEETPNCPRCKLGTLKPIPDVDVRHCDSCGYAEGTAEEVIAPTEIITATEKEDAASSAAIERRMDERRAEFDHVVAMGLDDLPDGNKIKAIAIEARILSMSPLAPKFLRGNPWACFDVGMTGALMGIPLAAAAELIDIIPDDSRDYSKGGRKSLSPELLNAMVERKGLGSVRALAKTELRAVAVALEPGGALDPTCTRLGRHFMASQRDFVDLGFIETLADDPPERALAIPTCRCQGIKGEYEFTWEEAQRAELAGHECQPGNHKEETRTRQNGSTYKTCGCNQGYKTYPKRMMWWRASGFCVDDNFATAGLGLYSAEELGAFVDVDGRMIDPSTVELPEGFEPEVPPEPDPADPADIGEIRARVRALPEDHRKAFLARWEEKVLEGRLAALPALLSTQVAIAKALVNGAEANAKKDGWKPEPATPAEDRGEGGTDRSDSSAEPPGGSGPGPGGPTPAAPGGAESPSEPEPAPSGTDAQPNAETPQGEQPAAAPEGMTADLAAQYGLSAPALTKALANGAIAVVEKMTSKALNAALRAREMATDGEETDRRRHLAEAMAREQAEQDWKKANATEETA